MALEVKLDHTDRKILGLLQENGRLSYAEIGRQVGLSLPAAAERVRRLESAGIITGYHAAIDPAKIGFPITVFIQVQVPVEQYPAFKAFVENLPEVVECHHVTGNEAFILKAILVAFEKLEALVAQLSRYGQTTSSVVMSSLVTQQMNPLLG